MTKLIIIGGFLGSGKTTLLWQTTKYFISEGKKVGVITNDQAPELVDSSILRHEGIGVAEVSGSCFCCNFNGFSDAIRHLKDKQSPDVIIAEPVGSCADLSATILQPLKKYMGEEVQLMPFTVLADAERLPSILEGGNAGLHPDAAYIFRKQMEESDILLLTKTDVLTTARQTEIMRKMKELFPSSSVMSVCAFTGEGLQQWLGALEQQKGVGLKLLTIDYDQYAHGEAVLGWLNGTVKMKGPSTSWNQVLAAFIEKITALLRQRQIPVGHVKAIVENETRFAVVNLTDFKNQPSFRGDAGESTEAVLTINARVETSPEELDSLVKDVLSQLLSETYTQEVLAWKSLQPGRPNPTFRFAQII